jgi:LacI family transcriptional regulator
VFCFNDFRAHLLVNALHREGFAVPDDMAVTGFDGTRDQPMTSGMKLTSYDVRTEEAYRTAVRLLLDVIDGRPIPQENLVPGELIVGETT